MNRLALRPVRLVVALAAIVLVSACSADSPIAPQFTTSQSKASDLLKSLIPVQALNRDDSILVPIARSFTFTAKGGKIEIQESGLTIHVPAGAIPSASLTITVTVLPGTAVAYDFQPHGTQFLKPLSFSQSLKNTSWDKVGFKGTIDGGYFKDVSQVNLGTGIALLDEILPITIKGKEASFDINHFSGYMVSGGRKGAY
ncbi:MAG: hypothetical protein ABI120_11595 [Gemmatimonadaceae bacterium]